MFGSAPKQCAGCRALAEEVGWLRAQNEKLTKLLAEDRAPGVLRRLEPQPKPKHGTQQAELRRPQPTAPGYEPLPPTEEVEVS